MGKAYQIIHESAGWAADYDYTEANGPLAIGQDGRAFLKDFYNRVDERGMLVVKSRAFRKGGCGVNDTETGFTVTGSTGFRQIARYGNNVARFTTDAIVKKGTSFKSGLHIGSFTLPGEWTRLLVISQDGTGEWRTLKPGKVLEFTTWPLAWVFERQDGFRCEISTGFDLWRWNHGLDADGARAATAIAIHDDDIDFDRKVFDVTGDPVEPTPRDYRFCHQLAWTVKNARQAQVDIPAAADVSSGKADADALGDFPALSIDLRTLPVPDSARVDGKADGDLCWESKAALAAAKTVIRQLAGLSSEGRLHISGGLTPSVCTFGKHVDRPRKETAHWDLNGIVCFSQWVRQTLGAGWKITCAQEGIWKELPSMLCLFGTNGFGTADVDDND